MQKYLVGLKSESQAITITAEHLAASSDLVTFQTNQGIITAVFPVANVTFVMLDGTYELGDE